jgi:hypothetical protein
MIRFFVYFSLIALIGCRPLAAPPTSGGLETPADSMRSAPWEDIRGGDEIIAALEKYNTDRGHYPGELSELVPSYLPGITPPKFGEKKWTYSPEQHSFALFLWAEKMDADGYGYGAPEKKWEVIHNSF